MQAAQVRKMSMGSSAHPCGDKNSVLYSGGSNDIEGDEQEIDQTSELANAYYDMRRMTTTQKVCMRNV